MKKSLSHLPKQQITSFARYKKSQDYKEAIRVFSQTCEDIAKINQKDMRSENREFCLITDDTDLHRTTRYASRDKRLLRCSILNVRSNG